VTEGSFQARRAAGGADPVGDDRVLAHVRRSRGNDDHGRDFHERSTNATLMEPNWREP
jgi:hypothetical protein